MVKSEKIRMKIIPRNCFVNTFCKLLWNINN